ncbi:hypothetical protein [Hymenobacter psychrotolerans]|uniref:hypothetical protein n=1 Tax=Hymenobacter psychrotolerans TaxID=344998 RepID=UPI001481704B|nr:hypothetical protein [Hymenobacter psychrotolerans]
MQCAVRADSSGISSVKENPSNPVFLCPEIQNIRVNIHFLQHDNGSGNFAAENDGKPGIPSTATNGYE